MARGKPVPSGKQPGVRGGRRRPALTGRAAILALVIAALAITLAGPLREYVSQRSQITDLRSTVDQQQRQVDELTQQKKEWADPAYVAKQARDRLHYVMPGEVPEITIGPTPPPAKPQGGPDSSSDGGSGSAPAWYAALWGSVREAGQPGSSR